MDFFLKIIIKNITDYAVKKFCLKNVEKNAFFKNFFWKIIFYPPQFFDFQF
jgi:hypothetical protein